MTTLTELADRILAERKADVFFRVIGQTDVFHVCPSGHGNPAIFSAFNTSTGHFVPVSGKTSVKETEGPSGMGYYGFHDLEIM